MLMIFVSILSKKRNIYPIYQKISVHIHMASIVRNQHQVSSNFGWVSVIRLLYSRPAAAAWDPGCPSLPALIPGNPKVATTTTTTTTTGQWPLPAPCTYWPEVTECHYSWQCPPALVVLFFCHVTSSAVGARFWSASIVCSIENQETNLSAWHQLGYLERRSGLCLLVVTGWKGGLSENLPTFPEFYLELLNC